MIDYCLSQDVHFRDHRAIKEQAKLHALKSFAIDGIEHGMYFSTLPRLYPF